MELDDPLVVGLVSAAAGALLASLATRWLERRHQQADRMEVKVEGLVGKVHELETRIAVLETFSELVEFGGAKSAKGERSLADA